jgi:DNA-binding FadR family transcriptional regulator
MTKLSRKQKFISQIENNILSGKWKIGEKIPTERELVEMYGASRTVVNAALSELAQKGFLNINPRQWTQVADYKKDGTLAVLISVMEYNGEDVDFGLLQSVLDARRLVETESARLAAENRKDEDIKRLEKICEKEKAAKTLEERAKLDYSFHHALTLASGNIVYPLIINSFEPFAKKYLAAFYERLDDPQIINERHGEIVNSIKMGDAEKAERLVRKLLLHGEKVLKTQGGD